MSSVTHPQSEQPSEHEELVAYLDGELAPEECRKVEERLANDATYRQHLRDLDQAWEALGALPATAVDDGFARTTIELACVAAEEDLSQRTSLAAVENRGRRRWWIAGAVAAAVIGFIMVRALAVHRNNTLLADLPVITQINALGMARDVDFLRQLSKAGFDRETEKDESFPRAFDDFTKANSASLDERRAWANSLAPEKKAELAERMHTFAELGQKPGEPERLRKLANDIRDANDAAALNRTLVAYGQWLSRQRAPDLYQLRIDFENVPPGQQVDAVLKMAQRENEQAARNLSDENKTSLRNEIFALVKQKRADYLANLPADQDNPIAKADPKNEKVAMFFLTRALQNDEGVLQRLEEKLTPDARDHLNRISRWQPDRRRWQMWAWIHEATHKKPTPEQLERFFASDAVKPDVRQALLDMPKDKMDVALEKLYWKTELGIDEPPSFREFGDRRGPRNGQRGFGPPDGERRGPGPQRGSDGPPPDRRLPPPDGRFDREPLGSGPDGPRRPRPEENPERGRRRPPNDGGERDGRPGPALPPPRPPVEKK